MKFVRFHFYYIYINVTLHVRVWIEILYRQFHVARPAVTLHVRVWIEISFKT